jgi:hypothetical protein
MTFDQPWALAGLLGALLILWLGRRLGRPMIQFTGAFALWRAEDRSESRGAHKNRIPPARWALALALAFASLALARPHANGADAVPLLRLCFDGSPSMQLEMSNGQTREEAALARTQDLVGDGKVRKVYPSVGAMPDEPGVIWVTDRCPDPLPVHAGVSASGGQAVPGPIAVGDGELIRWTGRDEGVTTMSDPWTENRSVRLDPTLPACVAVMARVWAEDRGLALQDRGGPRLHVRRGPAGGTTFDATVRGDGWSLAVNITGHALGSPRWTVAGPEGTRTLVGVGPGVLEVAFGADADPDGDPAAFALDWAEWLDEALPVPATVIPLAERRAAGDAFYRAPRDSGYVRARQGARFEPWLAAAAALAAALALALSMGGRPL